MPTSDARSKPLSDARLRTVKPAAKAYRLADGRVAGLSVLVTPKGAIAWRFRFRDSAGKEQQHSLGLYPDIGIESARRKAQALRSRVAEDEKPAAPRKAKAAAARAAPEHRITLAEAAATWLNRPGAPWAEGHAERVGKRLQPVLEKLGGVALADVTAPMLADVLVKLAADRKPEFAARARGHLDGIFQAAAILGHCSANPAATLKDSELLPPVINEHHPAFTEPRRLGQLLRAIDAGLTGITRAGLILQFMLAPRPGELRAMRWADVDLQAAIWVRTQLKVRGSRELLTPLPEQALAILRDLRASAPADAEFVLPGRYGKRPLSEATLNVALDRIGFTRDEIVPHGSRSTFRTMATEQLDAEPVVCEAYLGHFSQGPMGDTYDRAMYLRQRRVLAQQWADYMDKLRSDTGADVVPIVGAA
jgi:integrase